MLTASKPAATSKSPTAAAPVARALHDSMEMHTHLPDEYLGPAEEIEQSKTAGGRGPYFSFGV
jgi:hypothetical protein